jgi:hypothetical protein
MTILDSLMAVLDSEVVGTLGDPITYERATLPGAPVAINAFVDNKEEFGSALSGTVTRADVEITVRRVDVEQPASGDLITLPQRNELRRVTGWAMDSSGRWWILKTARA